MTTLGSLTDKEKAILNEVVQQTAAINGPIIEIGTLFGHTTQVLALANMSHKQICTIDNYSWNPFSLTPNEHRQFTAATLRLASQMHCVKLFDCEAAEFYNSYDGAPPSVVFLDGDHSYEAVLRDLNWAVSVEANVICGHDFADDHPGVVKAVREVFGDDFAVRETLWIHGLKTS